MVKLAEIMEAIGCSKASASDYRRGKHAPHVSTWQALAELLSGFDSLYELHEPGPFLGRSAPSI